MLSRPAQIIWTQRSYGQQQQQQQMTVHLLQLGCSIHQAGRMRQRRMQEQAAAWIMVRCLSGGGTCMPA